MSHQFIVPSTEAQREIWTSVQMGREASLAYNESVSLQLEGPLNVAALVGAIQALLDRHEALRACFSPDGRNMLIPEKREIPVPLMDWSALAIPEQERRLMALFQEEVTEPFDLEKGPLFRARLIRRSSSLHLLVLTAHHIICDGWSYGVMLSELGRIYSALSAGQAVDLPAADAYTDYSRYFETAEARNQGAADEAYWLGQFQKDIPVLELPVDYQRPALKTYSSSRIDREISPELLQNLRKVGAKNGSSFVNMMFTAFQTYLFRLTGQERIVVGLPSAGQSVTGMKNLVGHCVNLLPLVCEPRRELVFADFLKQTRKVLLDGLDHQLYTFGSLLTKLPISRDPSRLPLVSVQFNVDPGLDGAKLPFDGLRPKFFSNPRRFENFEIFLNAVETKDRLVLECQYNSDLFDAKTIELRLEEFETLLEGIVANPQARLGELPILPEGEKNLLLNHFARSRGEYAEVTEGANGQPLADLVSAQAAATPALVAVEDEDSRLSYAELDEKSNRLARHLIVNGTRPGEAVGICLDRSVDLVVAALSVLKAGAAYLPLDPAFPKDRLEYMVKDSGARILLTQEGAPELEAPQKILLDRDASAISSHSASRPEVAIDPMTAPAYLIYTSGSTGRPKGVVVPHSAVVNFLRSMRVKPGMNSGETLMAVTTLSFDISVLELFLPLSVGGRTFVVNRCTSSDGEKLLALLQKLKPQVMQATPSTWRLLLNAGWNGSPGMRALCGGEALPRDLADDILKRVDKLWNMYGPTETTVWSCVDQVVSRGGITLGRPIANTEVYVLDEKRQAVPVGVPGELFIGGAGVTLGYHGRPELTEERYLENPFFDDPFRAVANVRLYRTGDRARFLPDGRLEYLGRNDFQVKLRGYRIELGEIESWLNQCEGVEQSVATVQEPRSGDQRLVAYLVFRNRRLEVSSDTEKNIREQLKTRMPEYMVPQHFVALSGFPLTANGKVDRKRLPALSLESARGTGASQEPPKTETEKAVAKIWEEILALPGIGAEENFFLLGGHSLLATQVITRTKAAFEVELSLKDLFECPSVRLLAARVEQQLKRGAKAAPHGGADWDPIPENGTTTRDPDGSVIAKPSLMQQRLWYLEQLSPGTSVNNLPSAWRFLGRLDLKAFQAAFDDLLERHPSLRTQLVRKEDRAVQKVLPELRLDLTPVDLPPNLSAEELEHYLNDLAEKSFDLETDVLVRAKLLRFSDENHVLFFMPHHAVFDGWSFDMFLRDLMELYRARKEGRKPALPEIPIRYIDFSEWHRDRITGEKLDRELVYWKEKLSGELPVLDLPADKPRPSVMSYRGKTQPLFFPKELVDRLTGVARTEGATLFMLLLAAFKTLLYRYSGQNDVIVGAPIQGRNHPAVENLIGFFVNTLVMRTSLAGEDSRGPSFREVLGRVRETCLGAFAHQDMPFEVLVDELNPPRDVSRTPIYQAFFSYQDTTNRRWQMGDVRIEQVHLHSGVTPTDISFWVKETGEGLSGAIDYNSDIFDPATIARFLESAHVLFEQIARDPAQKVGEIPIVSEEAARRMLVSWNATLMDYPRGASAAQLILDQVKSTPDAVAIQGGGATLTYRELDERSSRLAARLAAAGVRPDTPVGMCLERSPRLLESILGIWKVGAGYLPLDPAYPKDRLGYMIEDSGTKFIVTEKAVASQVADIAGVQVLSLDDAAAVTPATLPTIAPESLAYVIYTSGSTGKPKGVEVPHRALVNFLTSMKNRPGITDEDAWVAVTTPSFDISVLEMILPLTVGARVVMATRDEASDGRKLLGLLQSSQATILQATPSTWRLLIEAGWREPQVKALCGGEALPPELASAILDRAGSLWNMYGPTETTIWSTCAEIIRETKKITLGCPIGNTQIFILDQNFQPVPVGVPGDLWIGGDGVTRGYLNRPELTRERFVVNPLTRKYPEASPRIYLTGDQARYLPDGTLEYLGRKDQQVKLRGHRIELGEIESVLAAAEGVHQAVAIVKEVAAGDARLLAYLVPKAGEGISLPVIRKYLRANLPDYMVPQQIIELESLPLTRNGKIDRKALTSRREEGASPTSRQVVPPRTETEQWLAGVFQEVLGIPQVGITDNFFNLGGHSLLSMKVVARIEKKFGKWLNPRVLLLNNLEQVALQCEAQPAVVAAESVTEPESGGSLLKKLTKGWRK